MPSNYLNRKRNNLKKVSRIELTKYFELQKTINTIIESRKNKIMKYKWNIV